ncbi:MAG: DNA translocase FtsK [Planctomycetota bacterium]|nr:DNA translocase FtsK [Planctomycetota bacterium]
MKEDPRKRGAARVPSRGPELLGGVLFLVGCVPAVALIKAIKDQTDFASEGLGGTAAMAAEIATWVGKWPGLLIFGAVAAFGTMAVLGALRTDLTRRVVGVFVCGLGVSTISSALAAGSGGRIGDGTGAQLAAEVGPWAGILVGLGIVAVALWLAFAETPATGSRTLEVSLDGPELRRTSAARPRPDVQTLGAPRSGEKVGKARRTEPAEGDLKPAPDDTPELVQEPAPKAESKPLSAPAPAPAPTPEPEAQQAPAPTTSMPPLGREADPVVDGPSEGTQGSSFSLGVVSDWVSGLAAAVGARLTRKRPRVAMPSPKKSEPMTLGDALVQGETEGVSHDEAAALAPDGDTLAYMEEVWREASASQAQVAPLPPSPYPADPRLKGEIPAGTTPLGVPADAFGTSPEPLAPLQSGQPVAEGPQGEASEVAPFDLVDDLEPAAMEAGDRPADSAEEAALAPAQDLPDGVEALRVEDSDELTLPRPPASWEGGYEEESESDKDGAWTRGNASAAPDGVAPEEVPAVIPVSEEPSTATDLPPVAELFDEDEDEAESSLEEESEPVYAEEELEEVTDDTDAEAEDLEEEASDAEDAEEEAEYEEDSDEEDSDEEESAEEVEYEYVDEDGNPIDLESLEDGAYELVDEAEYEEVAEDEAEDEIEAAEDAGAVDDEEEAAELEADEDADPAFESEGDEYEEAAEDEAPVVLEPLSPLPGAVSPAERLLNAGRVLVRQGRAAVSVLQQELDMEFDEACALLDQLQEEGLIGPYKGGKKRDILLSEEEWEDHFARS